MAETIKITLVKSGIGSPQRQKDTLKALGLRKLHKTVERADDAVTRGMIAKVFHLVAVEEGTGESPGSHPCKRATA